MTGSHLQPDGLLVFLAGLVRFALVRSDAETSAPPGGRGDSRRTGGFLIILEELHQQVELVMTPDTRVKTLESRPSSYCELQSECTFHLNWSLWEPLIPLTNHYRGPRTSPMCGGRVPVKGPERMSLHSFPKKCTYVSLNTYKCP